MSKARELASLGNAYSDGALSNRNLIINGAMAIDQRNAGAAITGSSSTGFPVDRFALLADTTGTVTAQQVSDAPAGFVKSAKVTCTTAATSDTSSSRVQFVQAVEGYNTASLGFGGANAKYITVSFWVKASNAGTYGGSIVNNGGTRSYPYSYTISAPNVWEYKTVTVAGDTIGAWEKDNLVGLFVFWILGAGSNFVGTADQWQNSFKPTPASTFSLKDTLNATWQITGVQLEVGDTATPFEHRSYGQELALCQRYFERYEPDAADGVVTVCQAYNTSSAQGALRFSTKRVAPTVTVSGVVNLRNAGGSSGSASAISLAASKDSCQLYYSRDAAGLTGGYASLLRLGSGGYISIDAEL